MLFSRHFLSYLLIYFLGCGFIFEAQAQDNPPQDSLVSTQIRPVYSVFVPDSVNFAGESVPLHDHEIRERLIRELEFNAYKPYNTLLIMKRAGRWEDSIKTMLREEGVSEDFFYLAIAESNLDEYALSYKKALGFWQFLAPTAKQFGLKITSQIDERKDPIRAGRAACKYFKQAYKKFGNWTCAAASYNRGMAGLNKALTAQKTKNYYDLYLNRETYRYIFRIIALKVIFQNPDKYGFFIKPDEKQKPLTYKEVKVTKTINLTDFASENGISYRVLKLYNPWLDSGDYMFTVTSGKSYIFRIPTESYFYSKAKKSDREETEKNATQD